jgi:hypothetical protein
MKYAKCKAKNMRQFAGENLATGREHVFHTGLGTIAIYNHQSYLTQACWYMKFADQGNTQTCILFDVLFRGKILCQFFNFCMVSTFFIRIPIQATKQNGCYEHFFTVHLRRTLLFNMLKNETMTHTQRSVDILS